MRRFEAHQLTRTTEVSMAEEKCPICLELPATSKCDKCGTATCEECGHTVVKHSGTVHRSEKWECCNCEFGGPPGSTLVWPIGPTDDNEILDLGEPTELEYGAGPTVRAAGTINPADWPKIERAIEAAPKVEEEPGEDPEPVV